MLSGATTLDEALSLLGDIPDVDAVLCLEQMSLLQEKIESFTGALAKLKQRNQNMVFGGTMGPSHHPFNTYNLDDYRRRDVAENGKMMTELCHPIHKAAHDAILEIAKERYGYTGADVYPHTKPFDLPALKQSFEEAGFANLALIEDAFEVGGEEIVHYLQNGWTFFFRFPPFADLPTDEKIAILIEAIEKVRAMPEYDEWCAIAAHHPVAYYIAW